MQELQRFRQILASPYDYLSELSSRKKIIGCFCTYAPEEIIHAAGFSPLRITGFDKSGSLSDSHLQAYTCSVAVNALEDLLAGRMDFLSAAVFVHTCDTMQRLSDIWRLNSSQKHFDLILPVKLNTESSAIYFSEVFKTFCSELETEFSVKITDESLQESICLMNRIREKQAELCRIKSMNPGIISEPDILTVMLCASIMEKEEYLECITGLCATISSQNAEPAGKRKRIILSGGMCTQHEIFSLLEKYNAQTVYSDMCTGNRNFEDNISETGNPLKAIAERYLMRAECPSKHRSNTSRADRMCMLTQKESADGVVFIYPKFCDPHSFDYPYLKERLNEQNIPSLLIELDDNENLSAQTETRIQAFIDML